MKMRRALFLTMELFSWDKYSGWDRIEGVARQFGLQYSTHFWRNGFVNALFGQSYHLFGENSFANVDMANTGLDSGLQTRTSDYVGRIYLQLNQNFAASTRARFDQDDFELKRFEAEGTAKYDPITLSVLYAKYAARPDLGFLTGREGVLSSASYRLNTYWTVNAGLRYDITDGKVDGRLLGLTYLDECFSMSLQYWKTFAAQWY